MDAPDRLAATLALDESVGRVRLASPARARALEALGVRTVRDLVTHFPRRYIDLSPVSYTHLDVYKRQGPCCSAPWARRRAWS